MSFVFPGDVTLEHLIVEFFQHGFRAQIVGPHGSGKSTLLRNLIARMEESGSHEVIELDPRELAASNQLPTLRVNNTACVLVIDGIEQLPVALQTGVVKWTCDNRIGLLCTCHSAIEKVPVLWTTGSTFTLFRQVVDQLVTAAFSSGLTLSDVQLRDVFDRHAGDVRESLFELYDVVQKIR